MNTAKYLFQLLFLSQLAIGQQIRYAEFYLDSDPGFGKGQPITIATSGNDLELDFELETASLSKGWHFMGIRARDDAGKWGLTLTNRFFIFQNELPQDLNIVRAEYFIDHDPGFGIANSIPILGTGTDIVVNFSAILPQLNQGMHSLGIRAADMKGRWGNVLQNVFFYMDIPTHIASEVNYAEYFIDNDPGFGKGIPIQLPQAGNDIMVDFNGGLSEFCQGEHRLFVRARNKKGQWGQLFTQTFQYKIEAGICMVTVDEATGLNKIFFESSDSLFAIAYRVYTDSSGIDEAIGYSTPGNLMVFKDMDVLHADTSCSYKVSLIDFCNVESEKSTVHKTIHLQLDLINSKDIGLRWNAYQGSDISTYRVYRGTTGRNMEIIAELTPDQHTYTDTTEFSSSLYYKISAQMPICNNDSIIDLGGYISSSSNIVRISFIDTRLPAYSLKWHGSENPEIEIIKNIEACINETIFPNRLIEIHPPEMANLQWKIKNSGEFVPFTSESLQLTSDTTLYIEIAKDNGCIREELIYLTLKVPCTTLILPYDEVSSFTIYPNPADEYLHVSLKNSMEREVTLKIYTVLGLEVYVDRFKTVDGAAEMELKLDQPGGCYYVVLFSENRLMGQKALIIY